ncbi:MAG TPA: hypothetical protein VJ742_00365 [Nitrososphaera sp.]|nr:hypothetical protein [Nitrososphaera sp.]
MNATKKTLAELANDVQIEVRPGEAKLAYDKRDEWQKNSNDYRLTLKYQGRRMSLDFWQGMGIKTAPDAKGVLDCLLSDASCSLDSFEDFCSNCGYDSDSRKAYRLYTACVKSTARLQKLLGADYDAFFEAQRGE